MLRGFPVFCENGYYIAWIVEELGKTSHHIAKTMVYREDADEAMEDAERLIARITADRELMERGKLDVEQTRGLIYEER